MRKILGWFCKILAYLLCLAMFGTLFFGAYMLGQMSHNKECAANTAMEQPHQQTDVIAIPEGYKIIQMDENGKFCIVEDLEGNHYLFILDEAEKLMEIVG